LTVEATFLLVFIAVVFTDSTIGFALLTKEKVSPA
jgi:hypothetical protein